MEPEKAVMSFALTPCPICGIYRKGPALVSHIRDCTSQLTQKVSIRKLLHSRTIIFLAESPSDEEN